MLCPFQHLTSAPSHHITNQPDQPTRCHLHLAIVHLTLGIKLMHSLGAFFLSAFDICHHQPTHQPAHLLSFAFVPSLCIVLYCIVLLHCDCIVLYCIVLYCIVLYCRVLSCLVLYCIVLYCIVLSCLVLSCIVLFCVLHNKQPTNQPLTHLLLCPCLLSPRLPTH